MVEQVFTLVFLASPHECREVVLDLLILELDPLLPLGGLGGLAGNRARFPPPSLDS